MPRRTSGRNERQARRLPRQSKSIGSVRKKRLNRYGFGIIAFVAVALLCTGYLYFETVINKPTFDEVTMCPINLPPAEITTVLIDASDVLSPVQTASVRNEIDAYRSNLPTMGALEIYTVGQTEDTALEPLFHACNPGSPTELTGLTESISRATRKWREGFIEPVEDALTRALPSQEQKTSPILESIQSVAVTAFGPSDRKDIPKRLIIVSDMMQNSASFSSYKSVDYSQFKPIGGVKFMADLRGVEVEILYVRRHPKQGKKHIEFWQSYFSEQGARLTRVFSVSG
tara:strand:+ start:4291 stop:5148 length:858 start_codon:yes stop_codon:yes gene_type:complete